MDIPFYEGLRIGVPSLPAAVEALAEGRYDLVHLCSPGPAGVAAALIARIMDLPMLGSYHTELGGLRGAARRAIARLRAGMDMALAAFYGGCYRGALAERAGRRRRCARSGSQTERIGRWDRGVDLGRFGPSKRTTGLFPGALNVLYAGRLTKEKGVDLLADAFLAAHAENPGLHLVLAGGGPEESALRERLGATATFLGWLEGDALARAYASADVFLFASRTDTFGQVILEAQASGLPVRRGGRGRAGLPGRKRAQRATLPAGPGSHRGVAAAPGGVAVPAPAAGARAEWRRCVSAAGKPRSVAWPTATARRSR